MATQKKNVTPRDVSKPEDQPQAPGQGGRMTESSPNPHNETHVADVPVTTDQRNETGGQNIGGTPSTREGRIHPSVAESGGGGVAGTDSLFNDADPQTAEIGPSGVRTREQNEPGHKTNRKAG